MSSLTFSFATHSDATAVGRLLSNCGLPDQDVHEHLEHFIVAKDNYELVRVIGLEVLGRIGLLRSLAVDSRYRNQGLGKVLYAKLVGYAHLQGITKLYLLTLTARDYFSRLRFEEIDRSAVRLKSERRHNFAASAQAPPYASSKTLSLSCDAR